MSFSSGFGRAALATVLLLAVAVPADAQLIRRRPLRPIFSTTQDPSQTKDRVDVSVLFSAGHDHAETRADGGSDSGDPFLSTATFGGLFATGTYQHDGRKIDFFASGSTSTRYYDGSRGLTPLNLTGSAGLSGQVGRRGSFSIAQSVSYSPYHSFSFTPGFLDEVADAIEDSAPAPVFDPDTDLRTTRYSSYDYGTTATYATRLSRRSSGSVSYALAYVDSVSPVFDLVSHNARGRYSYGFGRSVAFNAGYGARVARYIGAAFDAATSHDLDVGLSYNRALFSSRTRVSFYVSSAFVTYDGSTQYRINGSASLRRVLSRRWSTAVFYNRGNDVFYGFAAPFVTFTDSIGAMLNGRIGRSVQLSGTANYTHGNFTLSSIRNVLDSGAGVVRVHLPVLSWVSAYTEGQYAEYRFARRIGLLPLTPTATRRLSVRGGLSFAIPVLR